MNLGSKLTPKQLGKRIGAALVKNSQLSQCYLRLLVRLRTEDREEAIAEANRLWSLGGEPDQELNSLFMRVGKTV